MANTTEEKFPLVRVENAEKWVVYDDDGGWTFTLNPEWTNERVRRIWPDHGQPIQNGVLLFIQELYNMKVGEVTDVWPDRSLVEFNHAKIKLGDVFSFYTNRDGVLIVPEWASFKFAVMDYHENDPRIKFHPNRVRAFIEGHGIERLDEME